MRRILAGVLLSVLLVQSSGGAALAASGYTAFSLSTLFASATSPIRSAWLNSAFHAMLTGQMDRYEAMHAPRPTFPHTKRMTPPNASRRRGVRMERRDGRVARVPGLHKPEAVDPHRAARDPMAMRKSVVGGHARLLAATTRWTRRTTVAMAAPRMHLLDVTPTPEPTPCPPGDSGIPPNCTLATPTPEPTSAALAPSTTGINHYWTYEEEPLPGIGKAMVNVGNGNLVVQVDDVDIPERGIDLAFRRTYNAQSQHDANGTDGSTPSVFGNGWTNTFDAHMAYDSADNILSVYDIDGARYDFCADGEGNWYGCTSAGANDYTQLTSDGACGYYWTKKTGTAYYFEAPNQPSTCTGQIPAGLAGRILAIEGRNVNNSLTFTYSWVNGDATNPENLTQILVQHSDGQSLTLTFALLNGTGPDELQSIARPDGATISYEYDSTGELLEVDRPGNTTTTAPQCSDANTLCIPETYTYFEQCELQGMAQPVGGGWACNEQQTYVLESANSPRYTESYNVTGGDPSEGDTVNFDYTEYDATGQLTTIADDGVVNFTPNDGVSPGLDPTQQPLQYGYPTGVQNWYTETFSGYGSGVTSVSDSDGHARMWTTDGLGRVTMTQEWTGSQWLVSYEQWDSNDDLLAFTDERDDVTTFAYDANGNAIMEAQPQVTTSMGTFQPTAWYQYDQYNNLLYYCDPNWVHGQGGDYPNGSDVCIGSPSGVVHYVWSTGSSPEIYGELTDTYTPLGYHHHLSYDPNGMPLSVVGDTISQADGTQRTPDQQFTYDTYGNLQTYNPGNGAWHLTYDNLNRVTMREDPDGVYSYTCYYADGSVQDTESAYQHALDGGTTGLSDCGPLPVGIYATAFAYDPDGDTLTETSVHGGVFVYNGSPTLPTHQAVTTKFYDGDDRLVEVEQAYDSANDIYTNPWITRYLYDLSQNGQVTFDNGAVAYQAHGGMYSTEELLPPGASVQSVALPMATPSPEPSLVPNTTFEDLSGTAFDALDRPVSKYSIISQNLKDEINTEVLIYDSSPSTLDLLAEDCNSSGQCKNFSYDARQMPSIVTFSDSTPSRSMLYDPDERTAAITSSEFGTEGYAFDADGRLVASDEADGGGVSSPATLTRHYYADGKEESVDLSSSALSQTALLSYSYRADGLLQTEAIDDANVSGVEDPGTTTLSYTYSATGRLTGRVETGIGANTTPVTITYDPNGYGHFEAETTPEGSLTSAEYSAEDELLGILAPNAPPQNSGAAYTYTTRGEVESWPTSPTQDNAPGPQLVKYADGAQLQFSYPTGMTLNSWEWDDRMGVPLTSVANSIGGVPPSISTTSIWGNAFDSDGRLSAVSEQSYSGNSGCIKECAETEVMRTFDAENHTLISGAQTEAPPSYNSASSNSVLWGPDGHPIMIGSEKSTQHSYSYDTLHWDGDTLLFVTTSAGTLRDVKIGALGDILPQDSGYAGLTFYDRDPAGGVMGCHNAVGSTFAGLSNTYIVTTALGGKPESPCSGGAHMPTTINWWGSPFASAGVPNLIGNGGVLGMPRADGYTDGTDTIQGARTSDAIAGTWTTPDAYAGLVSDPASQKPYMWNNNNPEMYADPSGYDAMYIGYWIAFSTDILGNNVLAFHAYAILEDDSGRIKRVYSFGPDKHDFLDNDYGTAMARALVNEHEADLNLLASCIGTCAWEAPIDHAYDSWENGSQIYWPLTNSSNTALSETLGKGGLDQTPGLPGWLPGWDGSPFYGIGTRTKGLNYGPDLSGPEPDRRWAPGEPIKPEGLPLQSWVCPVGWGYSC